MCLCLCKEETERPTIRADEDEKLAVKKKQGLVFK